MSEVIANYMGFKYSAIVDVDNSDCGGLYDRVKVFSKIPIEVDSYPDSDQYYIKVGWHKKANENGSYLIDPYFITWDWIHDIFEKISSESTLRMKMKECRIFGNLQAKLKLQILNNKKEKSFEAIYNAIQFINSIEK